MTPADVQRLLELRTAAQRIPFCPHTPHPKQADFLRITAREGLFGGEAGGGKSDVLLMGALVHVETPGFAALILRRTFKDLSQPNAIMDRSHQWFGSDKRIHWNGETKTWTFPSRARIVFGHCETEVDRYQYQGAEYNQINFDELTQFPEVVYTYMFSRLRRLVGVEIATGMRAATNPGGVGHSWVMKRFGITEGGAQKPSWTERRGEVDVTVSAAERPFQRSSMDDNPSLDVADYRQNLAAMDETTRAQLERGLWIQDAAKRIYPYHPQWDVAALPVVSSDSAGRLWKRVFVVDLGASTQDKTTSFTRLAYHDHIPHHVFVEMSTKSAGEDPWSIADMVEKELTTYGDSLTVVMDEGALGKGYGNGMRSRHGIPVVAAVKSEKRANMRLLKGTIERGHVHLVRGQCDALAVEMDELIFDKRGLDEQGGLANHCCDGLLYGWRWTYAHRSQAPDPKPVVGTPEWENAEADRLLAEEYAQHARQREEDPWSRPED